LFNRVTESAVYAADQLFATLDPTLSRVDIDHLGPVMMADTVGFISNLPHTLVEAFKATLEETLNATLLLHVIDVAADRREHLIEEVELVLEEIGADKIPQLRIYNKVDLLEQPPRIVRNDDGLPVAVYLSARDGQGIDLLLEALRERLQEDIFADQITCLPQQARLRAALFEAGAVIDETFNDDGSSLLTVRLPRKDWERLQLHT
jgi:GTP-binding protein HflX